MKRFGKRAQMFLLAAVIISLVVISLGITANQAKVKKEPNSFKDFAYEVKRETGAVVDFEVYSGFDDDANLTNFVELLAEDIKDRDPNANFLFLYGDNDSMTLKNYGSDTVTIGDDITEGAGSQVPGKICFGGGSSTTCINPPVIKGDYGFGEGTIYPLKNITMVIEVFGQDFSFFVSKHRQVIFIIQKSVKGEEYVFVG